ncbi:hypothetical protein BGZ73_000637 [Actinomortierella ambigua]|nr:hypothetical protein BGZ73_000637 [Actinomortierella ambigua]
MGSGPSGKKSAATARKGFFWRGRRQTESAPQSKGVLCGGDSDEEHLDALGFPIPAEVTTLTVAPRTSIMAQSDLVGNPASSALASTRSRSFSTTALDRMQENMAKGIK